MAKEPKEEAATPKHTELAGGAKRLSASGGERRSKKRHIRSLSLTRGKSGGHVVRHEYEPSADMPYEPPQEHVFGKDDGHALMKHLARHAGIKGVQLAPEKTAAAGAGDEDHDEDGETPGDVTTNEPADEDEEE